jgi:hypothetical protein
LISVQGHKGRKKCRDCRLRLPKERRNKRQNGPKRDAEREKPQKDPESNAWKADTPEIGRMPGTGAHPAE